MKRDFARILDRYLERFEKENLHFDDSGATYLMATFRQLLESEGELTNYPTVNFYANWILHSSLDRNNISQAVLEKISSAIPNSNGYAPAFVDAVCDAIREGQLQSEIIAVCSKYSIRNVFSDRPRWIAMYGVIITQVTGKPLNPPNRIPAGSSMSIRAGTSQLISNDSTIRFWLHGNRGEPAQWSIAIVPDGTVFDINNLVGITVLNGGVFAL